MLVYEVTSSRHHFNSFLTRRNKGAPYSRPPSSRGLFPRYATGHRANLRAWPSCRCEALSSHCALWKDILTPLDTNHPSADLLDLHFTACLSPQRPSPLPPLRTYCWSPASGESKGQPLLTDRDEGRAWIATHQPFYYGFFRSVAATERTN